MTDMIWLPFQIYYTYQYFLNKKWKANYRQRHWIYKAWVWFNIVTFVIQMCALCIILPDLISGAGY